MSSRDGQKALGVLMDERKYWHIKTMKEFLNAHQ